MVKTYRKGQTNTLFVIKLQDNDNPYEDTPLNLTNHDILQIEFTRPDGTRIAKTAEPTDSTNLTDTTIEYLNNESSGSIFDQTGIWTMTGSASFTNSIVVKGVTRQLFSVIP